MYAFCGGRVEFAHAAFRFQPPIYFARHGAVCPSNVNPAEYMLEAIGAGVAPRVGDRDWNDIWLESPEFEQVKQEIADMKTEALAKPVAEKKLLSTCE